MMSPPSHCDQCGSEFAPGEFPKSCATCGTTKWLNPLPVAVLLTPVSDGLLVVRRGIEPHRGKLALPGGFVEESESWRRAAARELLEETGFIVDHAHIEPFGVESANNHLLVFGLSRPLDPAQLDSFEPNHETMAVDVVREPIELAFGLHTEMMRRYFFDR